VTYAHQRPYVAQASITPTVIPHLGAPSERLARAFLDTYQAAVFLMRTPGFIDNLSYLANHDPVQLRPYVLAQVEQAGRRFQPILANELLRLLEAGAAIGRLQLAQPMQKAGDAGAGAGVGAGVGAGATAADLDTAYLTLTAAQRRARGLPPPLFPALRIPHHPSSIRIPKAPRWGRGQAPIPHIEAARNLALDLVVNINDTQRDLIGDYIEEAITRGIPVDDTAMRVANVTGLFPRWARAVSNYHSRLLAQGMDRPFAQKQADKYADRLRKKRGWMISRTEIQRAQNLGRLNSWREFAAQGHLDADNSVKSWVGGTPGSCPICTQLGNPNGDYKGVSVVGLETPFDTPLGPVLHPPLHPNAVLAGSSFLAYGRLEEMVKSYYRGPAVLIETNDYQLAIGPNHPMLTRRGMVPANALHVGDELAYDVRSEKLPPVEEVFEMHWLESPDTAVVTTGHDLHGDRVFCDDDIYMVHPVSDAFEIWNPFTYETVTKIRTGSFEGWAFDASTSAGLYNSGGFVVSNCRCTTILSHPVMLEPPTDVGQSLRDVATVSDPELQPVLSSLPG
jgi:hypothetical protein